MGPEQACGSGQAPACAGLVYRQVHEAAAAKQALATGAGSGGSAGRKDGSGRKRPAAMPAPSAATAPQPTHTGGEDNSGGSTARWQHCSSSGDATVLPCSAPSPDTESALPAAAQAAVAGLRDAVQPSSSAHAASVPRPLAFCHCVRELYVPAGAQPEVVAHRWTLIDTAGKRHLAMDTTGWRRGPKGWCYTFETVHPFSLAVSSCSRMIANHTFLFPVSVMSMPTLQPCRSTICCPLPCSVPIPPTHWIKRRNTSLCTLTTPCIRSSRQIQQQHTWWRRWLKARRSVLGSAAERCLHH